MLDTLKTWMGGAKINGVDTPLAPGYDLRGYKIERVIHRGGMSWVYKAWDPQSKPVIIKEFFPHSSAKRIGLHISPKTDKEVFFREAFRRFHEEGRYMGLFRGANFGRVRTFFRFHGTGYLVLEWERGRTLASYIRIPRKKWASWQVVKPLANDIRLALLKMHQANVLHLDIHPANILLTLHNRGIVLDFGAARHAAEPVINAARFYTPGFSAPEIKTDSIWGPWTDVYSFGCCLRALGALRPEQNYPIELQELVKTCLVDNPKERIRSFDDPRMGALFS